MNKSMIQSGGYVLLAGLILAMSSTLFAADNNLHFSGNLLSKSCALVVELPISGRGALSHGQSSGFERCRPVRSCTRSL